MNRNNLILTTSLLAAIAVTSCREDGESACDRDVVGNICTIVGNNENGYDRDADTILIPALDAKMSLPQDTLTAPDGSVYILDWNNHRVRHLDPEGMLGWVACSRVWTTGWPRCARNWVPIGRTRSCWC